MPSVRISARSEAFIADERAAHGVYGALAGETVMEFCVFTCGLRGKTIREWDARSCTCLIEEMAENPIFPDEWLENAVRSSAGSYPPWRRPAGCRMPRN